MLIGFYRETILIKITDELLEAVDKGQRRPQSFSLKKWVGRETTLSSAGQVYSLNIPEKLIYMQPVPPIF